MPSRVSLQPSPPGAGLLPCLHAVACQRSSTAHLRQPVIDHTPGLSRRFAGARTLRRFTRDRSVGPAELASSGMGSNTGCPTVAGGGNIFVYGTLMAEEIVTLLIDRVPKHSPATLTGHRRVRVKDADFPAVIPSFNPAGERTGQVEGLLLQGLDEADLIIFDDYEDDDYTRETASVTLPDGSHEEAYVYIWADHVRHKLTSEPWDYDLFRERDMETYISRMQGFLDEMRDHWAELRQRQ